jgi:ATP-binding cassette, subfamily F, member 3
VSLRHRPPIQHRASLQLRNPLPVLADTGGLPTPSIKLSDPREPSCGEAASSLPSYAQPSRRRLDITTADVESTLSTTADSPYPPPFSSLYFPADNATTVEAHKTESVGNPTESLPPFTPVAAQSSSSAPATVVAETKAALPRDTKEGSSSRGDLDDGEPPPPYSEGSSPIASFTYIMASAGGPASIITQVSQGGGPPINALGG